VRQTLAFFKTTLTPMVASLASGAVVAGAYILVGHGYYGMMLAVTYAILFLPLFFLLQFGFGKTVQVWKPLFAGFVSPSLVVAGVYLLGESDFEISVVLLFGVAGLLGTLAQLGLRGIR